MALTYLEDLTSQSTKDLPTINEYEKTAQLTDGDAFSVIRVKRTTKCLVIETTEFVGFIWNNEKLSNQLLQAILHYIAEGEGYEIKAVYMKKLKRRFTLALDDESDSLWTYNEDESFTQSGKFSVQQNPPPPSEENPLIKPKRSRKTTQPEIAP